jgi:hypothetical protein
MFWLDLALLGRSEPRQQYPPGSQGTNVGFLAACFCFTADCGPTPGVIGMARSDPEPTCSLASHLTEAETLTALR